MSNTKRMALEDNQDHSKTTSCETSLPENADRIDATAYVAGVYVAVVQVRGDHVPPRYRRRTFWNLPSAQRAVDRAHMEGKEAHIVLCKLVPMGGDLV